MQLPFLEQHDHTFNYLPYDGIVNYYGTIYDSDTASAIYQKLLHEIEWKNDEAILFGKKIITKRKVAWYAQKAFEYTYSNITKVALPFTETLNIIKQKTESLTNETYNACLLNLYHNGNEGMAWHSDGEPDLKKNGAIASLSFGAERKFAFKHKQTAQKVELQLAHGSLLVMKDTTQKHWLHRLPPTTKINTPRINLTFRTIENS
jgi:alkylated DNA repair dioxygenase AlkB